MLIPLDFRNPDSETMPPDLTWLDWDGGLVPERTDSDWKATSMEVDLSVTVEEKTMLFLAKIGLIMDVCSVLNFDRTLGIKCRGRKGIAD